MTPEAMADLHARAFAGQGRAWSAQEFTELLQSPHVFAITETHGFALGRVIADEAELLTIATDPDHRRRGIGRLLLYAFEADAAARRAQHAFLEVADDNIAALSLYSNTGYQEVSRRGAYYTAADGRKLDALIMRKPLA